MFKENKYKLYFMIDSVKKQYSFLFSCPKLVRYTMEMTLRMYEYTVI